LPNPDAEAPVAPPPARAEGPSAFEVDTSVSLETRLEQLMTWACAVTGLSRVFIADAEGLLVASLNSGAKAVDEAASIVQLCTRAVPQDVSASERGTVSMSAGEHTHVVAWELTRHGKTYIALSGTVEPNADALSLLSTALRDALR
jgi:acetylornithine/succinyldiaminopimelate/putrescine aminotransferase